MKAQSVPFSHRTIDINIDFPLPKLTLEETSSLGDEDENEENRKKMKKTIKTTKAKKKIMKMMRMVTNSTIILMTN